MQKTDRTTRRDEEELSSYGASSIGNMNSGMLDDSSNSPRAPTAERIGQEEKEKRKKKVLFGSLKSRSISIKGRGSPLIVINFGTFFSFRQSWLRDYQ